MAITEIKRTHTAAMPDENYVEDPKIVKIAKLVLILTDKDTDMDIKQCCLRLAVRMGHITETEAKQLALYKGELENYREEQDEF